MGMDATRVRMAAMRSASTMPALPYFAAHARAGAPGEIVSGGN